MPGWMRLTAGAVASLATVGTAIVGGAVWRWQFTTARLVAQLTGSAGPSPERFASAVSLDSLDALPPPVMRYFRSVLKDGQPYIRAARVRQTGQFRVAESEGGWRRFDATQSYSVIPPGYVWDARIRMAPLVGVNVRDSYVRGRAAMRGAVLGLVDVVNEHDKPELDSGALQRYLAEAVLFPTALLPGQGVTWNAIDSTHALATVTDGVTTASLQFEFGSTGDIVAVSTRKRYRAEDGRYVERPWGGAYRRYEARGGMRIPLEAEVYWETDGGRYPYDKLRLTEISYEFA